jgi:hypothetical protein
MARAELHDTAAKLDAVFDQLPAGIRAFYAAQCAEGPKATPRIAIVTLPNMHRASRIVWSEAFSRTGWELLAGPIAELRLGPKGLCFRERPIDVLWGDFVFYPGYQYERFSQTRFGSRVGDLAPATAETSRILRDPKILELLRTRRFVLVTPPKSYLAMSKHLLSWIHRPEAKLDPALREALAADVARTWSTADRLEGGLTMAQAIRDREGLLLKPCENYGGGHGVLLGRETPAPEWARQLDRIWTDPGWVVQEFHLPRQTADGQWISIGLYNYGGQLGGVTIRTSHNCVVSARSSAFIPVTTDPGP